MKDKKIAETRVLALDLKWDHIGFAVFESSTRLIDFGVVRLQWRARTEARIASLLTTFCPAILVLKKTRCRHWQSPPRAKAMLKHVRNLSRRQNIAIAYMSETHLQRCFRTRGVRNRQQIVSLLSGAFPDLEWRTPRPRKPWHSEDRRMAIFEAAALGACYLGANGFG